jgi:hypothetical protein
MPSDPAEDRLKTFAVFVEHQATGTESVERNCVASPEKKLKASAKRGNFGRRRKRRKQGKRLPL